ncbi:MAG: hypothetical protein ACM33T_10845 [Solirubrobacterales bacterium]
MRAVMLAAAALAVTALPALAQQRNGEFVQLSPPEGWQPAPTMRTDKTSVTRLFPPGQSEKDWTETLAVQVLTGSDQMARPYVEGVIAYSRANCDSAAPGPVTEATRNGYPSATVQVACSKGKATGLGGFILVTAIRGKDALYVIQRQWRGPAFEPNERPAIPQDTLRQWGAFSQGVSLCDTRDPRHPCR